MMENYKQEYMNKIKPFDFNEVESIFEEFIDRFLSAEPETLKKELLPRLWAVVNKKHDLQFSITCEYEIPYPEIGSRHWYARAEELDDQGKVKCTNRYFLEHITD